MFTISMNFSTGRVFFQSPNKRKTFLRKTRNLKNIHWEPKKKGKSQSSFLANTLHLYSSFQPVLSLPEVLTKSHTSLTLFNNGYKLLGRKIGQISFPMKISEFLPASNLFSLYQSLTFLHFKLEDSVSVEYFIMKTFEYLSVQSPSNRIQFFNSLIFMKLSEKNYEEGSLYCEQCLKDTELPSGDVTTLQIHLFYVSCLKGLDRIEDALQELLKCVELLLRFAGFRKSSYVKLVFLSLADVYVNLDEGENAIKALLDGVKMLENAEGKEKILEFLKEGWELVEDLENLHQLKTEIESLNDSLHGNNKKAAELYFLLAKHSILTENFTEAIKYREKILNLHKMNNMAENYFDSYSILASLYLKVNPKFAQTYIIVCENLVKNNSKNSSEHMVNLMWYKYYKAVEDQQKASEYFERYLQSYPESKGSQIKLVEDHLDYGEFTSSKNLFEKSMKSYTIALDLNEKTKLKKLDLRIEIFEAIGAVYRKKNDFERSLEYSFQVLDYRTLKKSGNSNRLKKVNHEVMSTYISMNEFHLALHYGHENLKIFESEGELMTYNSAVVYFNMGFIYEKLLDRERAKEFYMRAKNVFLILREFGQVEYVDETLKNVNLFL